MIIQVHRAAEKIYKSMICFVCFRLFICIETQCSDIITYYLSRYIVQTSHIWNIQQDSTKQEKKSFSILWSILFYHTYLQLIFATNYQSTFLGLYYDIQMSKYYVSYIESVQTSWFLKDFKKQYCMFSSRSVIFEGRLRDSEFGTLRRYVL